MTYVSMLDKDGVVRVRQAADNRYDERGWNTHAVLIERWLHLDQQRAIRIREIAAMQAEMDALEIQADKAMTGKGR